MPSSHTQKPPTIAGRILAAYYAYGSQGRVPRKSAGAHSYRRFEPFLSQGWNMAASGSTSPVQTRPIDPDKLNALLGQAVLDMGAAMHAPLIVIGDKLGLYRSM